MTSTTTPQALPAPASAPLDSTPSPPRSSINGLDAAASSPHGAPWIHPAARAANQPAFQYNTTLHPHEDSHTSTHPPHRAAYPADLHVRTDMPDAHRRPPRTSFGSTHRRISPEFATTHRHGVPARSSSVKSLSAAHYTGGSLSPASVASSPGVGPLADMTPLPSPLGSKSASWASLPPAALPLGHHNDSRQTSPTQTLFPRSASLKKRKAYPPLSPTVEDPTSRPRSPLGRLTRPSHPPSPPKSNTGMPTAPHTRNRSLSEYVPPPGVPRPQRPIAVSGSKTPTSVAPPAQPMHREEYLAVQRGISGLPTPRPPTPPRSAKGSSVSAPTDGGEEPGSLPPSPVPDGPLPRRYEATSIATGAVKRWYAVRQLGTGTFSTVMLATSAPPSAGQPLEEDQLDRRSLVAVKVVEHGPAGGADAKKIAAGLQRELAILKAICHPSLIKLKAVSMRPERAFLVLSYCPGGDLFELASLQLPRLVPGLVRRMFAELVGAARCLHGMGIVHRDIKLENVLVNLPPSTLPQITDWTTHPHPIVTLTDLGLGRFIPAPPESPLLHTRCGSEDYAAPELLMGQAYDGRATDAWALGVLLYALLEGRLPFDPVPGARRQSPTSHRIARCEWSWVRWAGGDGEWDEEKGTREGLEGARRCVEGLLCRVRGRWSLERVAGEEWVRGGIEVEGGLRVEDGED